jgi:hypothetical protein
VGKEDGTGKNNAPGGGSTNLRKQLKFLKDFIESFDFIQMKPDFNSVVFSPGAEIQSISEIGKQYAILFTGKNMREIKLDLPKGKYHYEFVSPHELRTLKKGFFTHDKNGVKSMEVPEFTEMVALKIKKQ